MSQQNIEGKFIEGKFRVINEGNRPIRNRIDSLTKNIRASRLVTVFGGLLALTQVHEALAGSPDHGLALTVGITAIVLSKISERKMVKARTQLDANIR